MKIREIISNKTSRAFLLSAMMVGFALVIASSPAESIMLDDAGRISLNGDFRLRLERDWNSKTSSGAKREDRNRARIRLRLNLNYKDSNNFSYGFRLRSGAKGSQQSPHVTVLESTRDAAALLDRWYVKKSWGNSTAWLGRNGFPFWKQNELFWDDDVTPAGVSYSYGGSHDNFKLTVNTGHFALPDGGVALNGSLSAGQLVFNWNRGNNSYTLASGFFAIDGETNSSSILNGNRNYNIWVGNFQYKYTGWGFPFVLGFDYMRNTENYAAGTANGNEKTGYDGFVKVGRLNGRGDWLGAYYYTHIEQYAVNASYAQDDWIRWGSSTQTASSDLKGRELMAAYAFSKRTNLAARLFMVDAITSVQDGKRVRLDYNIKF